MAKNAKLNDLLNLTEEELNNTKIRLMKENEGYGDPFDLYYEDERQVTQGWFLWKQQKQGNPFKEGDIGIGLLRTRVPNEWLFVTAQKIVKNLGKAEAGVNYKTEIINKYKKYFGQTIRFHNKCQQMCRRATTIIDDLEVIRN
jgi:hypothetical protein